MEPKDESSQPHPIPFVAVRWMIRAAVAVVVIGFAWTIHTSNVRRNDALAAEEARQVELRKELPEITELRKTLAKMRAEENEFWTRARELARAAEAAEIELEETELGTEPVHFIDDTQMANLKGQQVQAEIRREALLELISKLERVLEVPPEESDGPGAAE